MVNETPESFRLTLPQKIRLAVGVFAIYWPIRLYFNIDHWHLNWPFLQASVVLWLVEIPLTIAFFTVWLIITEFLVEKLVGRPERDFLVDMKWPAQLLTLLIAGALATFFNIGFHTIVRRVYTEVIYLQKDLGIPEYDLENRKFTPNITTHKRIKADSSLTIMAMLMAFYLAANRRGYRKLGELRVQTEQLEKEAAQAQLAALRNQVNPHFLFNSLSILSSLVEVDTKLSVQFINRLSKAYRYILEQRNAERVPLRTELDFIESYTFLLRIRFDERLQVRIDISEADRDRYQIAPLTLQLLVENAVKHNQMSDEKPLIVSIGRIGDYLRVANPLQPRPQADESTGVGLTNIINRYALLSALPVIVSEVEGEFVVKIPLLAPEKAKA